MIKATADNDSITSCGFLVSCTLPGAERLNEAACQGIGGCIGASVMFLHPSEKNWKRNPPGCYRVVPHRKVNGPLFSPGSLLYSPPLHVFFPSFFVIVHCWVYICPSAAAIKEERKRYEISHALQHSLYLTNVYLLAILIRLLSLRHCLRLC